MVWVCLQLASHVIKQAAGNNLITILYLPHTAHKVGMKKLEKPEIILKIRNFKKWE